MPYPTKKLWEICDIKIWWTPSRKDKDNFWWNFLWCSIWDLKTKYILDTKEKITDKGVSNSNVKLIKKWTLLMSFKLSIWKLAFAWKDLYTNEAIAWLEINNVNEIDKEFLYYSLLGYDFSNSWKYTAVKWATLNKKKLELLNIPLPPLSTQKLIVAKLDELFANLDKQIELTKKQIENIEELNKSILEEVFSKGEWEEVELGSVTDVIWWGTPKTNILEYWWDDIVWLSPTDLPDIWEIVKINNSSKKISKLGLEKSSAKLLPIWTVIFSSRATIGKIAINTVELATNQGFANFVCSKKIYNFYLAYVLKKFTSDIVKLSNSTTFKEVNKTNLKKFLIPLPPLEIQKQIVSYLDQVFEKNNALKKEYETKLKNLEELKQSVLKEAFENEEFVK